MTRQSKGSRKAPQKRIIKSSKGGRTARAPEARVTPADLAALQSILLARGLSFGDWLAEKIAADKSGA